MNKPRQNAESKGKKKNFFCSIPNTTSFSSEKLPFAPFKADSVGWFSQKEKNFLFPSENF